MVAGGGGGPTAMPSLHFSIIKKNHKQKCVSRGKFCSTKERQREGKPPMTCTAKRSFNNKTISKHYQFDNIMIMYTDLFDDEEGK